MQWRDLVPFSQRSLRRTAGQRDVWQHCVRCLLDRISTRHKPLWTFYTFGEVGSSIYECRVIWLLALQVRTNTGEFITNCLIHKFSMFGTVPEQTNGSKNAKHPETNPHTSKINHRSCVNTSFAPHPQKTYNRRRRYSGIARSAVPLHLFSTPFFLHLSAPTPLLSLHLNIAAILR